MAPQFEWNFAETTLAMNIFLPDPLRRGQWDWRTPYYGDVRPEPFKITLANGSTQVLPPAQTGVIDFLTQTTWVPSLTAHHADPHLAPAPGRAPPDWPAAANLTPGAGTALAHYADEKAFVAMMRSGVRPDGSAISTVMPFGSLKAMSDIDLEALFLYLKSLAPRAAGSR